MESIESPLTSPFDYEGIYSQAYTLYRQGFRYWFDKNEILRLSQHNQQFETARSANELIDEFFRKPIGSEEGEYLSASLIMQLTGGTNMKDINATRLGRALTSMGFDNKLIDGIRRYNVVRRSTPEIQQRRQKPCKGEEESGEVW